MSKKSSTVGKKGKICNVFVKDFITYDEVKFYPGEYLNVIIGPNGTGKSSIVAAIVIGLGGNCKLLSRSTDLHDYVKNGKTEASIDIKMYKNDRGETETFTRKFKNSKEQTFMINRQKVGPKEYLQKIKEFNVQIDNLCQFLPQDRVQDFAKMNPQEILVNTQKSVCAESMAQWLEELIDLQTRYNNFDKDLTNNIMKLTELEERVKEMSRVIEGIEARKVLVTELEVAQMKKAWIEFEKLLAECKEVEKDLKKADRKLKEHKMNLQPLIEKRDQYNSTKTKYERSIDIEFQKVGKYRKDFRLFEEKIEKLQEDLGQSKVQLDLALAAVGKHAQEVKNAEEVLAVLKTDLSKTLDKLGDINELNGNIKINKDKCEELRKHINQCYRARDNLGDKIERDYQPRLVVANKRITNMENVSEMKLRRINQRFSDTYNGIQWLRRNRDQFRAPIYETPLMEINVKNPDHAKYLENTIGQRDLISFICEDSEDSSKLMKALREQQHLKQVNVAVNNRNEIYQPRVPLAQIKQYGFYAYLIDLIEGPLPVLNQLCRLYNIQNIPVGNDYTYEHSQEVPDNFRVFFTTHHRFSVKISKYSKQKSSTVSEIQCRNLMNITVDKNALKLEKENLIKIKREMDVVRNQQLDLEKKSQEINAKYEMLQKTINELESKITYANQSKDKINYQEQKIERLKNSVTDIDREKEKFAQKSNNVIKILLKLQTEQTECLKNYLTAKHNQEIDKAKLNIFQKSNAGIESHIREMELNVQNAKTLVSRVSEEFEKRKDDCRRKQNEAKNLSNGETPANKKKFKYKAEFDRLPADIEELKNHIGDVQLRIECLATENECDVEDYKNRLAMIEKLKEKNHNAEVNKLSLATEITDLHNNWYPELERIVTIINNNFSNFLSTMNYAGEIKIIKDANNDYKTYGIEISVKYRDEEKLQTLNRFVQSGGERAVAIAVYTLSLQHISNVPFRCVDEINQGMDRRNERKVFEMLVKETCVEGKSQYFFVTPKLLSNLAYNDLMNVHVVHHGVTD